MASTKIQTQSPVTPDAEQVTQSDATPESLTPVAFVAQVVALVTSATPTEDGLLVADQDEVNALFRSVAQADRNKARAALTDKIRTDMIGLDVTDARAVAVLKGTMQAEAGLTAKAPKSSPEPVDPRPAQVAALVTLRYLVATMETELGDLNDEESATVADADLTERVLKALTPKSGRATFTGERRSVEAHIQSAFADAESGTFLTVAQIRAHRSDAYGDDAPSAGAVSARLHGAPIDGVTPTEATSEHPFGATKV